MSPSGLDVQLKLPAGDMGPYTLQKTPENTDHTVQMHSLANATCPVLHMDPPENSSDHPVNKTIVERPPAPPAGVARKPHRSRRPLAS